MFSQVAGFPSFSRLNSVPFYTYPTFSLHPPEARRSFPCLGWREECRSDRRAQASLPQCCCLWLYSHDWDCWVLPTVVLFFYPPLKTYLLILEGGEGRGRKEGRETPIGCLICTPTKGQTCKIWCTGRHSNQLSRQARAVSGLVILFYRRGVCFHAGATWF